MKTRDFTDDEKETLIAVAEEHMRMNEIIHGEKHYIQKPNVFPEGYTGPRSFAKAMAMNWDSNKQTWSKQ